MFRFADSYKVAGRVRVTPILIIVMSLSFIVSERMEASSPGRIFNAGGIIPIEFGAPADTNGEFQRTMAFGLKRPPPLVTVFWSLFLHGGLLHLALNLLFLYLLGRNVEAIMGWARFTLFFFSCGAAGGLAQILSDPTSTVPIIGASGAISGLIGAYLGLFANHSFRLTIGDFHRNYRDYLIPFKVLFVLWIFNQLFVMLTAPQQTQNIAVFAHIGGFLCGLLLCNTRLVDLGRKPNLRVMTGKPSGRGPYGAD